MSVVVRGNSGAIEARSTHLGIGRPCQFADESALAMLGYVDAYDDTTFNQSQMRLVIPEMHGLIERGDRDGTDAGREFLTLAEQVERRPIATSSSLATDLAFRMRLYVVAVRELAAAVIPF